MFNAQMSLGELNTTAQILGVFISTENTTQNSIENDSIISEISKPIPVHAQPVTNITHNV